MVLSERLERLTLKEADVLETFGGLREDLAVMALAVYVADLAQMLAPEGDIYHLTVSALAVLARRKRPPALVKAAFELRALCETGLDPALDPALPAVGGDAALAARHIRKADAGKVYSFTLGDESLAELAVLCEQLTLAHIEREPPSLRYYREVSKHC
jgi:DNA repair protein RecO (recombination protein O)